MIGVIAKSNEAAVVEEFFQLFKTPWEWFQEGRSYDVVLATVEAVPPVDARLLILYGSEPRVEDSKTNITLCPKLRGIRLDYHGTPAPIYGKALTFASD